MKKYNTKPIDFTGCHPVIAEHLKRGEAIECWTQVCKESPHQLRKKWVCSYSKEGSYPYITTEGLGWRYAEPIPVKVKRIMPPERAIPVLIAEGWKFANHFGHMKHNEIPDKTIYPSAFELMGQPLEKYKDYPMYWPDCIIEEVEDDE